jgi:hypothetical protein
VISRLIGMLVVITRLIQVLECVIMLAFPIVCFYCGFSTGEFKMGIAFGMFLETPVEVRVGTSGVSWGEFPLNHEAKSVIAYKVFGNPLVDFFMRERIRPM